ncbi:MAG: NF038122 family metalloprotease [Planctomycetota bacterium]
MQSYASGIALAALLVVSGTGARGQVLPAKGQLFKPLCLQAIEDLPGPIRGGWDVGLLTPDELDRLIAGRGEPEAVVESRRSPLGAASRGSGLTVVFNAFGDVTPDAINAMQVAADYYATRIDDPITVTLDANFAASNFGGASPQIVSLPYTEVRDLLIADADGDDTLQTLLPEGSLPARFDFGGQVSQESEVLLTTANAKALGLAVEGVDGQLFIASEADGDVSDGIGNGAAAPGGQFADFSLVDILIHEVGHSLGFINVAEFGVENVSTLDLFRFAEIGPENPSDAAGFTSTPRAVFLGGFSAEEQHVLDFLIREHLASNASDFQASHFRETNFGDASLQRIGVMEPAITALETGFPEYFSRADFDAFDAIGWDIVRVDVCLADVNGDGGLTPADFTSWILAFNTGSPACDQNGDGLCTPQDFTSWVSNFNAGC